MQKQKCPDQSNIEEAAKAIGTSKERLSRELQRDAKRPIAEKLYPFADAKQNPETGRWRYYINAEKVRAFKEPAPAIDYDLLARKTAAELHKLMTG